MHLDYHFPWRNRCIGLTFQLHWFQLIFYHNCMRGMSLNTFYEHKCRLLQYNFLYSEIWDARVHVWYRQVLHHCQNVHLSQTLNFTFFLSLASLLPKVLPNVTSLKRPSLLRDCCFQIFRSVVKRRNAKRRKIRDYIFLRKRESVNIRYTVHGTYSRNIKDAFLGLRYLSSEVQYNFNSP